MGEGSTLRPFPGARAWSTWPTGWPRWEGSWMSGRHREEGPRSGGRCRHLPSRWRDEAGLEVRLDEALEGRAGRAERSVRIDQTLHQQAVDHVPHDIGELQLDRLSH